MSENSLREPQIQSASEMTSLWRSSFNIGATLCSCVGAVVVTRFVFRNWNYFIRRRHSLKSRYGEDSWALVTGATNGIGKTFSSVLAKEGFNLILIGRNPILLESSRAEIIANFPETQVKIERFDFSENFEKDQYHVFDELSQNHDISLLISCAGITQFERFHETDENLLLDLIKVNTIPSLLISRKIIAKMLQRAKPSGLIYLSSYTGINEMPFVSAYAGTKGFVDSFARSLSIEYGNKLDILSLTPYYVSTKMTRNMKPSFETITTDVLVAQALSDLGRKKQSYGSLNHFLIDMIYRIVPTNWVDKYKLQKMSGMIAIQDRMKQLRRRGSRKPVD